MTSKSTTTTNLVEKPKIASIALRYEDDPLFAKTTKSTYTNHVNELNSSDRWEKTSNSSSNFSTTKSRERVSYLIGIVFLRCFSLVVLFGSDKESN